MANQSILSNLSIGPVNPVSNGPATIQYYPSSGTPVDEIEYSIQQTTTTNTMQFPSDLPKYYAKIEFGTYSRLGVGGGLMQLSTVDWGNAILLPLPENLVDVGAVKYEETELGSFTGNMAEAAKKGVDALQGGGAGGAIGNVLGATGSFIASVADTKTRGAISSIGGAALGVAGFAPNKFLTILLSGPMYKQHELSWTVAPRNEQEASNLQKILVAINNAKSPGLALGGALFTFPKVVRVSYMPNSGYLYKFKPAIIDAFAVDYGAGGVPSFKRAGADGLNSPAMLSFKMRLMELEYWLKGDYTGSNNPEDVHAGLAGAAYNDTPTQSSSTDGQPQTTDVMGNPTGF